jgi:hypothetical protein
MKPVSFRARIQQPMLSKGKPIPVGMGGEGLLFEFFLCETLRLSAVAFGEG